jgi:hypothetical protein
MLIKIIMVAGVNLHGLCQTVWTRHTYSAQQTKEVFSINHLS